MQVFVHSISGVLVILIMVVVGYILAKKGWFDEKASGLIARLVTQVALPCYMIDTVTTKFTATELMKMIPNLRYPALSMTILLALALAVVRVFKIDKNRRGVFTSMFFNSNTVFVGLPINEALFGNQSIPYVLIYYMCNTTFFWTIGTYFIQKDGRQKTRIDIRQAIRKVFSPPLLGYIVGVIFVLLHIKLPTFLESDMHYLGGLTIPLSMIFIGLSVAHAGLNRMTLHKDNVLILIGRFICAPLLMTLIIMPISMPMLMKQVFILQSAMPVMTNAPVVAKLYGADADYAAVMVTETTLMTVVVVPIIMLITQNFV
ncbi:AEC family transporter [Ligilactobacillus sp. WILCCON 0076]|uniref:AEC family transporter n=1 Tax=Ligilactobacillus ubinensis TaxID=2876789 RepID=A0A9X2FKS2_9LACO|nr:AEC family transporter [Ligilactobacillus ubinensis]MCP0887512.1 AEC family transporter [Ligilactobacillus ubinensis]